MNAELRASLERALDKWGADEIYDDGLPEEAYWPNHLIENMARAAEAVFDANIDAHVFIRRETSVEE